MTDIDGLLRDANRQMSAWAAALDQLQAAITEVQRLGAVLSDDVTGSLLGPFVAASGATDPAEQRAALDAMTAAAKLIAPRAQHYANDCTTALSGPLAAAYAALPPEAPMATTRYVSIDFNEDYEANRIYVRNLDVSDTVVAQFTAPVDDPKFNLGITSTLPSVSRQRRAILTDPDGKVVVDWQASTYSYRFFTKQPSRGGQIELTGGVEYTLTVTTSPGTIANKRADLFFTVGT